VPRPPSTYRIQVQPSFDLHAAADVCDYLATLGVGAAYLSPLLPSTRGSTHGYDVIGFDTIDPARGGVDGWTRMLAAARARGLRVVVDIVPNHAGVADPVQNAAWWDLLRLGQGSDYAGWFDVDWSYGRVRLPVLGDDFTSSQLELVDDELRYFEHRFPLAPGTGRRPGDTAADVHARQHYELISFRRADTDQNYRRFFAVVSLAGLRVEDGAVFDATHAQILRWVRADGIDGLRIDHPDGLADPLRYLTRLRSLAGPDVWITVEKILEPGEALEPDWPVDGTTGYDALAEVQSVLLDPAAADGLDRLYRELTGDPRTFTDHVRTGKRLVATTILQAEVSRLARLSTDIEQARAALLELLVVFPVYRSYVPAGQHYLDEAVAAAEASRPELAEALRGLAPRLADPADELATRFQQASGAVMAKGVEDTAYYRYSRFIAVNEVGGDPARIGTEPDRFHAAQAERQRAAAHGMTAGSTHDTKRDEDVRARLAVLTEIPDEWGRLARQLMAAAPVPNPAFGYLLWQTFVGAGFIARERMHAYAEKAMREAADGTTWTDPDAAFEQAVQAVVDRAHDDPDLHDPLAAFIERITPYGWCNSLAQKLVQLTMPGVPDVYQGTEVWGDSLVDPDNRRPVDFDALRVRLDRLDAGGEPPPIDATGAAKLWVVSRTLRLRRDWPDLFTSYRPVLATGPAARHALAFDRGGAVTVATRLPLGLERSGGWRDTRIDVGGECTDVITGVRHPAEIELARLLADYPVALLVR
jgi:(1->4)-alpha-D-glucan 1-alpha-D-glucosylmutase